MQCALLEYLWSKNGGFAETVSGREINLSAESIHIESGSQLVCSKRVVVLATSLYLLCTPPLILHVCDINTISDSLDSEPNVRPLASRDRWIFRCSHNFGECGFEHYLLIAAISYIRSE
jgi:hypothetical protein